MSDFTTYKHGIKTLNASPSGDAALNINNNFTVIGDLFDTVAIAANYLALSGGTMTGNVAMGGHNITGAGTITATTLSGALSGNATTATTATNLSGSITESQVTGLTSDLAAKAPLASPTFTGTVSGITSTMVGLGNVTNSLQLVKANNLSDVANVASARANLGLGNVAQANVVAINQGGTAATTASASLANLGGLPLAGGTMTGDINAHGHNIFANTFQSTSGGAGYFFSMDMSNESFGYFTLQVGDNAGTNGVWTIYGNDGSATFDNGNITTDGAGTITAVAFVGDGSGLTGIGGATLNYDSGAITSDGSGVITATQVLADFNGTVNGGSDLVGYAPSLTVGQADFVGWGGVEGAPNFAIVGDPISEFNNDANYATLGCSISAFSNDMGYLTGGDIGVSSVTTSNGIQLDVANSNQIKVGDMILDGGNNSLILGTGSVSSPVAGQIYFDGTHFLGWNGSTWKQLDN